MKKYCTYITLYFGDKLPPFYIGSTSIKEINNGYNGSVCSRKYKSIYDEEQKENKHLFQTIIMRTFYRRKMATVCELYWQRKLNVVNSDQYFNDSFAIKNGYFTRNKSGDMNPMYGLSHSEETKQKISNSKSIILDNGLSVSKNASIKAFKTMSVIQNNGMNIFEIRSEKSSETMKNTFIDGKSINELKAVKAAKTMKNTFIDGKSIEEIRIKKMTDTRENWSEEERYKFGKKISESVSNIESNNKTIAENRAILIAENRIKNGTVSSGSKNGRSLKIDIYNENDELMFKCYGNFMSICKENQLPVNKLAESYRSGKRLKYKVYSKFNNWLAVVIP